MKRLALIILLTLCGCGVTSKKVSQLKLGQTRAEVISLIGQPSGFAAAGSLETMTYYGTVRRVYVTFEDGKLSQIEVY